MPSFISYMQQKQHEGGISKGDNSLSLGGINIQQFGKMSDLKSGRDAACFSPFAFTGS